MHRLPRDTRRLDRGFTLLELMIVMALLAFLVAMAWPALRKPLQRSSTQEAARQLVEQLGSARLNAIETGRTMAFRFELGGPRYWIGPADASNDEEGTSDSFAEVGSLDSGFSADADAAVSELASDSSEGVSSEAHGPPEIETLQIHGTLDNEVIFNDPAAVNEMDVPLDSTLGTMLADEMAETEAVEPLIQDEEGEISWSAPVLIYPTGRAENAVFVLSGPEEYSVTVTLRGLTGAVKMGPLEHAIRTTDESGLDAEAPESLPSADGDGTFDSLGNQGAYE